MRKKCKYTLADWPAYDQTAWAATTSTEVGYFARGECAHWAPETRRQAFYAYTRWLTFLAKRHPGALLTAPQDRLTPTRLEGFIEHIAHRRAAQTVASTINHFVNALRAIAPDYKPEWLRQVQKQHQRKIKPRNKRERMVPVEDLYALGFDLMRQAAAIVNAREAAWTFRDGLIIVVLLSSALRRKNLTALVIGHDLQRIGQHYQITIDATATKSKKRIDHPLPPELTPYLDQYLTNYRLRFAGAARSEALWLSAKGGVLCAEAIWDIVRKRTLAAFGRAVNLHLVRDIAATSAPELGTPLLGHNKATLTDQHYRRSDPLAASRKLGAVIANLRACAAATTSVTQIRDSTRGLCQIPPASRPRRSPPHPPDVTVTSMH